MNHAFRFTTTIQTVAEAQAEPAGIKRAMCVLAAQNGMPKPEVLWSGTAPDNALDKLLFQNIGQTFYLYDDAATNSAARIQKVSL